MALRELLFEVGFKGNTSDILKMDSAVDGLKGQFNGANKEVNNLTKSSEKLANKLGGALKTTALLGAAGLAAMGGFATKAVFAASEVEEMQGKFNVVFKGMEDDVRSWSETQAKAMGRSKYEFQGYLANIQNSLVGMGMAREEGAELSKQIVSLGVDLASFNNLAEEDALKNLESAISGNHNAAKSLGAVLNDNTLAMEMERMGLQGKFQDLSEATKMQVRYNSILSQSTDAVGDAERTNGSFANQMRAMKAGFKDMTAEIGMTFLPIATKMINTINNNMPKIQSVLEILFEKVGAAINAATPIFEIAGEIITSVATRIASVAKWASDNMDVLKPVLVSVGVAIMAALVPAFIAWTVATLAQAAATWAMVAPILAVMAPIIAVGVAIGAAIYIWKNWSEEIKNAVSSVWETITSVFDWIVEKFAMLNPFEWGGNIIQGLVDGLLGGIKKIKDAVGKVTNAIGGGIKKFFGINSPSKLMIEYGVNINEGLSEGMDKSKDLVEVSSEQVSKSITPKIDAGNELSDINSASKLMVEHGVNVDKDLLGGIEKSKPRVEASNEQTSQSVTPTATNRTETFAPVLNITVNGGTRETVNVLKAEWEKLMAQYNKRQSLGVV